MWWWAAILPATRESEEQESLEPRRQKFQWADTRLLHSSLGDRARLFLKKKKIILAVETFNPHITWCPQDVRFCCVSCWSPDMRSLQHPHSRANNPINGENQINPDRSVLSSFLSRLSFTHTYKPRGGGKGMDSGVRGSGFESHSYFLAVWLWASCLASLSLTVKRIVKLLSQASFDNLKKG